VLLERRALTIRPRAGTRGSLRGAQSRNGGAEELRRIALIPVNGKVWIVPVVEQPCARSDSQRRDAVESGALDRQSRGLSSESARRARSRTATTLLIVGDEKPTDGGHAQQHLRDGVNKASEPEVANAHAGTAAAAPLQPPGDVLLGRAVSCQT